MASSEDILKHWGLMRSYQKHKDQLLGLATQFYLKLCCANQGLPAITAGVYYREFASFLAIHPLFTVTIMQREKPHILPSLYPALSKYLVRYIIEQHWNDIASYPC